MHWHENVYGISKCIWTVSCHAIKFVFGYIAAKGHQPSSHKSVAAFRIDQINFPLNEFRKLFEKSAKQTENQQQSKQMRLCCEAKWVEFVCVRARECYALRKIALAVLNRPF